MNIMLQDSFSVRTMKLTPVSTLTPSVCGSTYPCWALGARPPQRDETIRPPTATSIGWHWTRTHGWAVPTFRVTCILSFALMRNIPEVKALVTLSPHLDQQILAVRACPRLGAYATSGYLWSSDVST